MNNDILHTTFTPALDESKLAADGNRYSKEFMTVSITVESRCGKLVDYFSSTQKNITGLYNQSERFIDSVYNSKSHNIVIKLH